MSDYVKNAPACLVDLFEQHKDGNPEEYALVVLHRLLTNPEMDKVWKSVGDAYASEHDVARDLAYKLLWISIWSAIKNSAEINVTKGESDKIKVATAEKILKLAELIDGDSILRQMSENLLWDSYKNLLPTHKSIFKDTLISEILGSIESTPGNHFQAGLGLMLSGLLSDGLSDLMRRYADRLIESTKNQDLSIYGKPRPMMIRYMQNYFERVLGRRSNEMTARVINAATLDCLTDQDIRA